MTSAGGAPMKEIIAEKKCTKCRETKPVSEFYLNKGHKDGHTSQCGKCLTEGARKYNLAHPEKKRERDKKYRAEHLEEKREYGRVYAATHRKEDSERHLMAVYGMKSTDYEALLAAQGGRCAVCGTEFPGGRHRRLVVDHDHFTRGIRGLLCHNCNVGIGYLQDSPDLLRKASRYLAGVME
jgi:hypothetical protein